MYSKYSSLREASNRYGPNTLINGILLVAVAGKVRTRFNKSSNCLVYLDLFVLQQTEKDQESQ